MECGRYWPTRWREGNPSLIGSGEYGFHPFHAGRAYESFPSGHAAVVFAVLSILWLCYPRMAMPLCALGHWTMRGFGGNELPLRQRCNRRTLVGSITGAYMTRLFGLDRPAA